MDGEQVVTDDHRRIGQRTYRAVVDRLAAGADPDDVFVEIDEHDAWFDSLTEAGAWVDEHSISPLDGRIDEYVWQETVVVDRVANRSVYDASRQPTGRYIERIEYYPGHGDPYAYWSFADPGDESGRFNPDVRADDELLWEYRPGAVGCSRGDDAPTVADLAITYRDLVDAVRAAWRLCESLRNPYNTSSPSGVNVPELLREALEVVATEVGGVDELVKHRPGSWEAVHVQALAAIVAW